jgi:hypothetical protein
MFPHNSLTHNTSAREHGFSRPKRSIAPSFTHPDLQQHRQIAEDLSFTTRQILMQLLGSTIISCSPDIQQIRDFIQDGSLILLTLRNALTTPHCLMRNWSSRNSTV